MRKKADHRRPTRLSSLILFLLLASLVISFVSGALVWVGQGIQSARMETPPWMPGCLVIHGALNPLLCGIFGYLCCQHARLGWKMKANRRSGSIMFLTFAGLILTGVGLYYSGSEWLRSLTSAAHKAFGVALPVVLGVHWIRGRSWAQKRETK